METKPNRIFLSYTHKDEEKVLVLYKRLIEAGYNPWIDSKGILGGEDWEKVIEREIENAALFLPCLTNNSINHRGVVQKEIKFALKVWEQKLEDDIYLISVRLEDCPIPGSLRKFHCINLFKEDGFQRLINSIEAAFDRLEVAPQIRFRAEPIENFRKEEVKEMLRSNGFYDIDWHDAGKGVPHKYELKAIKADKIIIDHTTGLIWQQSGSKSGISYRDAAKYIAELNERKFANFTGWRLPTLEEAMSLMEPKKDSGTKLHINSLFDAAQLWIWTSDLYSASGAWFVGFSFGYCYYVGVFSFYVRACRSP